ncbi:hypothetical protein LCGC14_1716230 [marine sediment metagenome]|uniref:Uncharacterized protein n=1 Tax=marine sediment metagenome TaxID=412755 RepID=A0A0F9HE21_9ZZZZ
MSKHTPGPWKIDKDTFVYCLNKEGHNTFGCSVQKGCQCGCGKASTRELKANTRLIASAPELLEACQYLEKVLLIIEKYQALPSPTILRNNIECLQQAIAKAEGKP